MAHVKTSILIRDNFKIMFSLFISTTYGNPSYLVVSKKKVTVTLAKFPIEVSINLQH